MATKTIKVGQEEYTAIMLGVCDGTTPLDTVQDWGRGVLATRMAFQDVTSAWKPAKDAGIRSASVTFQSEMEQRIAAMASIVKAISVLAEANTDWNIAGLIPSPKHINSYIVGGAQRVGKENESAAIVRLFGA